MACFEKWAQENPDAKKIPSEYRPPSMPTIPIEFKSLNVMYERMFLKKSRTTTEEEKLASITSQSKMYAADFRTDMMGLSDYTQTYIFKYLDLEAYRDCERTFNSHGGLKTTINAHMLKEAGLLKVSSKGDLRITLLPFWFEKEMKEPFWESVPDIAGNTEDDR
ncbi:hypothetical protein MPER_06680 [Moniliophthora perniciosa FA553]|nr:hypothetical protein MPER_06680 [Moniliophthora perniciosa FA553]